MESTFDLARTSRNTLEKFLNKYSLEQLNKIPEGFNNNLIWNIGHIVVVQQMLIYRLSGLPMLVTPEMVNSYKRDTKPEGDVSQEEVDAIKALLHLPIDKAQEDLKNGLFQNYTEFTTLTGYTIRNAKDAIMFNNFHEAIHTGVMMGIRKFVL